MIINAPRVKLRPLRRSDLDAMAQWPPFTDPLDQEWNWPHQLHENGTADLFFLSRSLDPKRQEWAITRRTEVIGYLGIRAINEEDRSARLGLEVGAPYVGQGYGAEALHAFLHAFFNDLHFHTLRLDVAAHNTRARRLYERCCFRATREWWKDVGLTSAFVFLDRPEYAPVRAYFRAAGDRMTVQMIEMAADHQRWTQEHAG